MKQLLLLILVSISLALCGQTTDDQWYIKNSTSYRDGSSGAYVHQRPLPNPISISGQSQPLYEYYIDGVTYPLPDNSSGSTTPQNDLFIIYEDGSYFNSFTLPNWPDRDGTYGFNGQLESYKLLTEQTIQYLYYTNVYEGDDDPNARVTTSQPNPPSAITLDNLVELTDSYLSINHTLVKGKDFTLIVDLETKKDSLFQDLTALSCPEFSVCWNSTEVSGIENHILPSPIFNQNYTLGVASQPTLGGNCATFTTSSIENSSNVFLNLRVQRDIPRDFLNKDVQFEITCGTSAISTIEVPLLDAHDPNFTDLVCIREEGDFYYASYIINCTNDAMGGSSTSASFSFVPPSGADSYTIKSIKMNGVAASPSSYEITQPTNTSPFFTISTAQGNSLNPYEPMNYDASSLYAEICIKFPAISNSPNDYLVTNGFTVFGTDTFPIHANLGLCEQYEVGYNKKRLPMLVNERKWCDDENDLTVRDYLSSSYCDCICGPSRSNWFQRFFCWIKQIFGISKSKS